MATDKYDLHTIDYSVQGWDAIMTVDMEKLDDVVHTRILGAAGETMAKYDAVYLESDGKYDKALADGVQQPVLGLVLVSAVLNDEIRIQRVGPITNSGWAWASVKKKVYLDPSTPGALTDVRPDSNVQMVGIVLSSTSIFIWIDPMEGAYDIDLRFTSSTELTIVAGVVTRSQTWHTIDTQDGDPSDDLDTINAGVDGCILIVRAENAARTVILKDSTGNLLLGGSNITLSDTDLSVPFIYDGTLSKWVLLSGVAAGGIAHVSDDPGPALGGQLGVGEHGIKFASLLSVDGKYSGLVCDGVLGATLAYGDLVYLNNADQRWELADADVEATASSQLAIVLAAGDDGDTRLLLLQGYVREDDWNFTSYGKPLFIGLTAGDMTQDVSGYTTGDIVRVVGHASTIADQIYFNPSGTWIEI